MLLPLAAITLPWQATAILFGVMIGGLVWLFRLIRHAQREGDVALASLRESEARFRSLADLSVDWYWEQDDQFRVH